MKAEILIGILLKVELLFFIISLITYFSRRGIIIRDAVPLAITTCIAVYSFFIQLCFLLGQPQLLIIFELVFLVVVFIYISKQPGQYGFDLAGLLQAIKPRETSVYILYIVLIYLAALAFFIPEGNYDSMRYNIARVPMFMQAESFFLDSFTEYHQVVFPVGGDILFYPNLRFNTDYGLAINAWFAYLAIISSSYAIGRYFGSRSLAITVMLIVASVPVLVFQATGTKPDIWCAAVASTAMLLLIRASLNMDGFELLLLIVLIAFGLSLKFTFVAFALPFCIALLLLIAKQPNILVLIDSGKNNLICVLLVSVMVIVLSQLWLMVHNHFYWGHFSGPERFIDRHVNPDGIKGAIANLVRYFFQSIHLLTPTNIAFEKFLHISLTDSMHNLYQDHFQPLLGRLGIADSRSDLSLKVRTRWGDGENGAWFGPLWCLIILPAIVYGLFAQKTILKVIAVCLICYIFIISWQISWMPWNGRFFSLVPAAGAALVAALLSRFGAHQLIFSVLRFSTILILCYCTIFNQEKELLNARAMIDLAGGKDTFRQIFTNNIWSQTQFGHNRQYYTEKYFGDSRVHEFAKLIPQGANVGVLTRGSSWVYPFFAIRPDINFTALTFFKDSSRFKDHFNYDVDYILCINTSCERLEQQTQQLWSKDVEYGRAGLLVKVL